MKNAFDLIITTNSPGELNSWVRPVLEELQKQNSPASVTIVVTPCHFGSGKEVDVAKSFPGVKQVIAPDAYKKWAMRGIAPAEFGQRGAVLSLGGDLFHAVVISRKLKYPAYAYTQKHLLWQKAFKKFFLPDEILKQKFLKKRVPQSKMAVVGDLMLEAVDPTLTRVDALKRWDLRREDPIIALLPGSRSFQLRTATPFFLRTAELIQDKLPSAQMLVILSPFSNVGEFRSALKIAAAEGWVIQKGIGTEGTVEASSAQKYVKTAHGLKAILVDERQMDALNIATLALTIPGTNTAELAALGVPFISIFPINNVDDYPLEGLGGILTDLPLLGRWLKRWLIFSLYRPGMLMALPNQRLGKMAAPEVNGFIRPAEVADKALTLLEDKEKRLAISKALKESMGERGAAGKIIAGIMAGEKTSLCLK